MTDTKHDDGGPAIRTGDLVRLKSGGPKMTVVFASDEALNVTCQWFGRTNEVQEYNFIRKSLVRVRVAEKRRREKEGGA